MRHRLSFIDDDIFFYNFFIQNEDCKISIFDNVFMGA